MSAWAPRRPPEYSDCENTRFTRHVFWRPKAGRSLRLRPLRYPLQRAPRTRRPGHGRTRLTHSTGDSARSWPEPAPLVALNPVRQSRPPRCGPRQAGVPLQCQRTGWDRLRFLSKTPGMLQRKRRENRQLTYARIPTSSIRQRTIHSRVLFPALPFTQIAPAGATYATTVTWRSGRAALAETVISAVQAEILDRDGPKSNTYCLHLQLFSY